MQPAQHISAKNLATHDSRLLAALRAVGGETGRDLSSDAQHWLQHWGRGIELEGPIEDSQQMHRGLASMMPCFAELVFTLHDQALRVGWMSGGRNGAHLAETVASLLHTTLTAHLSSGGDRARAENLCRLFGAAFPDLDRFREMSPWAQVFIIGVAPTITGHALKVYLNPRVSSGNPLEHLVRMAKVAGADENSFRSLVEQAYGDRGRSTKLYGLGVDLAPDHPARVKLYVRIERSRAAEVLAKMNLDGSERACDFVERFRHDSLTKNIELGLALVEEQTTIKVTQFWGGQSITPDQEQAVIDWIDKEGLNVKPLVRAFEALRAPIKARTQCSPLHAVGIEVRESLKVNVYAQPEL